MMSKRQFSTGDLAVFIQTVRGPFIELDETSSFKRKQGLSAMLIFKLLHDDMRPNNLLISVVKIAS
jgi:hypothetical protein